VTADSKPRGGLLGGDPQGGAIARALHAHGDKLLFLVVGGVNTVFAYLLFAVMLYGVELVVPTVRTNWILVDVVLVASWLVAVTFSWATFKLFVFRTRGTNMVREWARAYLVYAPSLAMNLGVMAALVGFFHVPPLLGQAGWAVFMAFYSYFGHKWFTFGAPKGTPEEEPTGF
jgi:putative flippase GtrA